MTQRQSNRIAHLGDESTLLVVAEWNFQELVVRFHGVQNTSDARKDVINDREKVYHDGIVGLEREQCGTTHDSEGEQRAEAIHVRVDHPHKAKQTQKVRSFTNKSEMRFYRRRTIVQREHGCKRCSGQ